MIKVVIPKDNTEKRSTRKMRETLSKMYKKNEEDFASRLAQKLSLPYADIHLLPMSSEDLLTLPVEESTRLGIICFSRRGKELHLGTPYPEAPDVLAYIKNLVETVHWDVTLAVISPSSLEHAQVQYERIFFVDTLDNMRLSLSGADLVAFEDGVGRLVKLKDNMDTISTTEILNIIFSGAVKLGASDVHIEPQKKDIRLRYRIDGVLQDVMLIPTKTYKSIVSRIKLMSEMKINLRDIAQDGHLSFGLDGQEIDVRVSSIPSKIAESIVMRILDNRGITTGIDELGLRGKAYDDLRQNIVKKTGMILTTGPTGSGKTTTLYTIISHIKTPESKIITIEDPIEYQLDGITQTEIAPEHDYTFQKGLRAIVRQDPDIILVGEIRDDETADIAISAALTGHLVLSTLHTNNAPATIPRLMELGVRPTLIPPATNLFMAQRLVRKLCVCKESYEPAQEIKDSIHEMIALISPKAHLTIPKSIDLLYSPVGCIKCHGSGYKGRIGLFEVLTMNESIEKLVLNMESETVIMKAAIEDGFVTITQDGILKALTGITSLEEVWTVTSEGDVIKELYDNLMNQSLSRRLFVSVDNQKISIANARNLEAIQKMVVDASENDILPILFGYAKVLGASDIHVEPQAKTADIRMRIDGVLQTIAHMPLEQYPQLLGQVKTYSGIPTTIRQGVSDSRFGVFFEDEDESLTDSSESDKKVDIRVSIIVGGYGETVVMRILSRDSIKLKLNTLGFHPYNLDRIAREIKKPYGMVLNTGPTGSGKTTTLYSVLQELNNSAVKIITIEDPIEYQLDGILQTQINAKDNYTFAVALRALLRQDPDIILVGEIRDEETAEVAVSASLTGHLLLSTLHTNDAVGAIQRLLNLGVRDHDLTNAINAFIAQRLVRKLCSCKQAIEPTKEEHILITNALESISEKTNIVKPVISKIYAPGSCEKCNGIGFKGRTVVSEVFVMTDTLKNVIARSALPTEIKIAAIADGMLTMEQDGILKVLEGESTLDEVRRVTML